MKGHLTSHYSTIFEKRGVKTVPYLLSKSLFFVRELYKSKKLSELLSFTVWESLHKFGLFPKAEYLQFTDAEPLTLDYERMEVLDSRGSITPFFEDSALGAVRSDHDWKLLFVNNNSEIFGCLYSDDKKLYKSSDDGGSLQFIKEFPERIFSLFISSQGTIFVCIKGAVYRSLDNGRSFQRALDLSSSESYFRRNYGMTETACKMLVIGEYANVANRTGWQNLAYLYFSSDNGDTWEKSDFLKTEGANKHVHLVWYSNLLDKLIVADGDNKKRLWVSNTLNASDSQSLNWELVNKFHIQMGGHTSVVEQNGKILFGTDYLTVRVIDRANIELMVFKPCRCQASSQF